MLKFKRECWFHAAVGCASIAAMVVASARGAWPADANPIVLRLSVDNPPGTPRAAVEEYFANWVEKTSDGRMKVQIFWSGSLGGVQRSAIDTVRAGGAEMTDISTSNFSAIDRSWAFFDLPFLFVEGPPGLYKYLDSPEFVALQQEAARKDGLHYVFPLYDDWRQLITTKRPIHTPDEINGIKLRTTGSPAETAYDAAFGAKPTMVDWGETYLALKNGLVDGYFVGYTSITDFNHNDAVKYGTTLNIVPIVVPIFISERFYQKLQPDLRKALDEAGHEAELNGRQTVEKHNAASIKKLEGEGFVIYDPPPDVKALWAAKADPVYAQFKTAFPPGMIEKIRSIH
jgi:TRAP-type transport system periplasmic protein